jgi:hypothetical protein
MLSTRTYIRNEGPLKEYCAQAYKLRSPSPINSRERIGNIGATIILSRDLALR